MPEPSTPVSRARAWRDQGLSREQIRERLASEGLDAGSAGIVLANVFPEPELDKRDQVSPRTAKMAGVFAIIGVVAGGVSVVGLAVGTALSSGFAAALLSPWVLGGNALCLLFTGTAGLVDDERLKAVNLRSALLGALAAVPFAVHTYTSTYAEELNGKGGDSAGAWLGSFGAGLTLLVGTYLLTLPVMALRMVLGRRR